MEHLFLSIMLCLLLSFSFHTFPFLPSLCGPSASRSPSSDVKLVYFGLSSFAHTPTEPGGTPEFLDPELLTSAKYIQQHGCGPQVGAKMGT